MSDWNAMGHALDEEKNRTKILKTLFPQERRKMTDTETVKTPDPYPKADLTDFDSAILLGANIIIQKWTPEEMSDGGIVLVGGAQQDQAVGWVVKVGNLVPPGEVCIGDTVIFPKHAIQALPEVGGRDDAATHFTEYNYLRAEDVVLRYPLHTIGDERDYPGTVSHEVTE